MKRSLQITRWTLTVFAGWVLASGLAMAGVQDDFNSYADGQHLQASGRWVGHDLCTVSPEAGRGGGKGIKFDVKQKYQFMQARGGEEAWAAGQTVLIESDFHFTTAGNAPEGSIAYLGLFQGSDSANPWKYKHLMVGMDFAGQGRYRFVAYDTGTNIGVASDPMDAKALGLSGGRGTSDWLRLKVSVTKSAGGNLVDISATVLSLGPTGDAEPKEIGKWSKSGLKLNPDVFDAAKVTGGYDLENAPGIGSLSADNFAMSVSASK